MNELKVPTVALYAEVLCADGRRLSGRMFVPATAPRHDGAMRAGEWLNEPAPFFPFLLDGDQAPVLLNKRSVLVVSVEADSNRGEVADEAELPMRRVVVEVEQERVTGALLIDMPEGLTRVLDYLNRPAAFLTVREGDRHHLVRKNRISRVVELTDQS
jgi:hypothetical protein